MDTPEINNNQRRKWDFIRILFYGTILALVVVVLGAVFENMPVPNPFGWRPRSPATRAYAEIKGIDLAVLKICADAHVTSLRELFTDDANLDAGTPQEILDRHTEWMYSVLRKGKLSEAPLKPERRRLLGDSYMEIGKDPWKNLYVFYFLSSSGISDTPIGALLDATYKEQGKVANPRDSFTVAIISAGKDDRLEFSLDPPVFREDTAVPKTKDDITNLRPDYDYAAYN
ncbi:MAG: hypothetical protein IT367_06220 [Candidatus Hydrogenedentes bacterium]|nr:hypothetical protein [Candidatus Hydrogenedentota bacterium]